MKIAQNLTELIGNTPLVRLDKIEKLYGVRAKLVGKLEYFNPGGSVKDRIALAMVEDAERKGILKPGSVIIEPTSGNTGIGLSEVARAKGYRSIIVMPENMSLERRKIMIALGSELVLTEAQNGIKGAISKAQELSLEIPNAFIPGQFVNPANPRIHYETTGPEIFRDTDGTVDILVSGVGTGGTISGTGKYLKEKKPTVKVIAVEPEKSPVLSGGLPGSHMIQGLGAGFIPETLDVSIYDEIIQVSNEDAFLTTRTVAKEEGLLLGVSSGAALKAAIVIGSRPENVGKTIVVIFPDTGERYFSTPLY